ncbi:hypothetical protein HOLleu_10916 [Holothuria leucospilota]|uniref:Uncharacterized protein n=1 Tax=Holothuria leucospilota TaxID=206669 RepID=A0A9Q1HG35_HOLLE|nr:hypothetical protein HOLleu_10916 [Holothuria leucospilota]
MDLPSVRVSSWKLIHLRRTHDHIFPKNGSLFSGRQEERCKDVKSIICSSLLYTRMRQREVLR